MFPHEYVVVTCVPRPQASSVAFDRRWPPRGPSLGHRVTSSIRNHISLGYPRNSVQGGVAILGSHRSMRSCLMHLLSLPVATPVSITGLRHHAAQHGATSLGVILCSPLFSCYEWPDRFEPDSARRADAAGLRREMSAEPGNAGRCRSPSRQGVSWE